MHLHPKSTEGGEEFCNTSRGILPVDETDRGIVGIFGRSEEESITSFSGSASGEEQFLGCLEDTGAGCRGGSPMLEDRSCGRESGVRREIFNAGETEKTISEMALAQNLHSQT